MTDRYNQHEIKLSLAHSATIQQYQKLQQGNELYKQHYTTAVQQQSKLEHECNTYAQQHNDQL